MAWIPASSPTSSAEPRTQRGKHQEKSRFGSSTGSLGFTALKQQQNILEFPLIPHFVPATPCIPLASFDFTF